jgi:hypothetical protein
MQPIHITRLRPGESGQTTALTLVVLSVFLLGVLGFATDYAQVWAHRQMAQSAADAACQAGAADLFLNYANNSGASGSYGLDFSWIGSDFTCSSASNPVCSYAALNGYSETDVSVTFPTSVAGVPSLGGFGTVAHPYIKVTVSDNVHLTLSRFLQTGSTLPVKASAICGMAPVAVPIPLVVLHKTASDALSLNGNPDIAIFGGPSRAIQVDSSSATALTAGGASLVDVHLAGPTNSGADIGVFGNEPQIAAKNLLLGSGKWNSPAFPYGDPWALIASPSAPATAGSVTSVGYGVNGCPDPTGCTEFSAGNYVGCSSSGNLASGGNGCLSIPVKYTITFGNRITANNSTNFTAGTAIRPTAGNAGNFIFVAAISGRSGTTVPVWPQTTDATVTDGGVTWKNVGNPTSKPNTAIFDPGLYYLDTQGMQLNSNSTVRPSTAIGDGSWGSTFYFSQGGTDISVAANSGSSSNCTSVANPKSSNPSGSPNGCVMTYTVDGTGSSATGNVLSQPLRCPSGAANSAQVPATVSGNILLGPCTGTLAAASSDGYQYRGFLFYGNRASSGTPSWGGGGQFLLAGFMYFHSSSYGSTLSLSGNSASGAYTLGNIVTDKLSLGGTSGIKMILNPASSYQILRPTLLQ